MLSKIRRPSQSQMFNFILIDLYRPDFKRLAPMLQWKVGRPRDMFITRGRIEII